MKGPTAKWKEFVANRVQTILDLIPTAAWRHIPGINNPADMASRGIVIDQLKTSTLWWHGPSWLPEPSSSWPSPLLSLSPDINLEERKSVPQVSLVAVNPKPWNIIYRFSRLSRLLWVTAFFFRAVDAFRHTSSTLKGTVLCPSEIRKAAMFWIRQTQHAAFHQTLHDLRTGQSLDKSCSFKTFTPFVDAEGILRVGGRLSNSSLSPDAKHPIILPADSALSSLIINDAHLRTLHGGIQVTLATIHQEYWILSGRRVVKSHVLKCVTCARHRAQLAQQLMGQLPRTRVTPSRPFQHSGVDYAGPFQLKTWRGRASHTYKAYLVLFVCFATSAVHLELATDYSTEGFLAAYRRFCGQRGACTTLISDCGSNFVGADSELKRLFNSANQEDQQLANSLSLVGTLWQFNPPDAPHFGGKWEAAVKSIKFHLKRVIEETVLTYEEFTTVLSQIEGILNSRPLCPLSDDPTDLNALTPAHFLIGESITAPPEPSLLNISESKLSRWQVVRQTVERFWHRWSSEYFQRLQGMSRWHSISSSVQLGTLALIKDSRLPPSRWKLARVITLHPGPDGLTRVVTLPTATETYRRPIAKLCILPIPPINE